jgi:hypothetical protein
MLFVAPLVLLAGCGGLTLDVQPGAESILAVVAGPSPAQAARWATDPYDPDNRYRGTLILGMASFAGEPLYIELFQRNLKDHDPRVRAAAARALGTNGRPEHADALLAVLDDDDEIVRLEAARGLQRIHAPQVVPELLKRLDRAVEPSPNVRAEAAVALGQYPENRVVRGLIAALVDRRLMVNAGTLESLRTLTGQDYGYDRRAWLDWFEATDKPFAARSVYVYPVFRRDRTLFEYIPFVPQPPNEIAAQPTGLAALRPE